MLQEKGMKPDSSTIAAMYLYNYIAKLQSKNNHAQWKAKDNNIHDEICDERKRINL